MAKQGRREVPEITYAKALRYKKAHTVLNHGPRDPPRTWRVKFWVSDTGAGKPGLG